MAQSQPFQTRRTKRASDGGEASSGDGVGERAREADRVARTPHCAEIREIRVVGHAPQTEDRRRPRGNDEDELSDEELYEDDERVEDVEQDEDVEDEDPVEDEESDEDVEEEDEDEEDEENVVDAAEGKAKAEGK